MKYLVEVHGWDGDAFRGNLVFVHKVRSTPYGVKETAVTLHLCPAVLWSLDPWAPLAIEGMYGLGPEAVMLR